MKIDRHTIEALNCFFAPNIGVSGIEGYIDKRLNAPIHDRDKNTQLHLEQHAKNWYFSYNKLETYCKDNGILIEQCPDDYVYQFSGDNTHLILNKCHSFWQGHNPIFL